MADRDATIAHELRMLLGPLRRAVMRVAPASGQVASLSRAQIELLRVVAEFGPLTTTQIAARLSLARPTVSNLVKALTQSEMLTRELSPTDFRSVLIDVSPDARRALDDASSGRVAVLQDAIDQLSDGDRAILISALPVLRQMLSSLQEADGWEASHS